MTRGRFQTYIFCALLAMVFLHPLFAVAGFGVTPPRVLADRLVPGATITKTIYLVQGNPEQNLDVEATIESRDIKEWISIEQGLAFTIPRGVQQYPLNVTIVVPEDAELGEYTAAVRVRTKPEASAVEGGGSGVAIALGGLIEINVTVGDDIVLEYKITSLDILDIKEREPLQAKVRISNTGNVPASPDSASFELFDKFGNQRLAFATAENEQFPRVDAFTENAVLLAFPVDTVLAVGEYWGHVKVYDEEGKVLRELRTVFNVYERTFLDIITSIEFIVGIIVVLVLAVFAVWKMVRKQKHISLSQEIDPEE